MLPTGLRFMSVGHSKKWLKGSLVFGEPNRDIPAPVIDAQSIKTQFPDVGILADYRNGPIFVQIEVSAPEWAWGECDVDQKVFDKEHISANVPRAPWDYDDARIAVRRELIRVEEVAITGDEQRVALVRSSKYVRVRSLGWMMPEFSRQLENAQAETLKIIPHDRNVDVGVKHKDAALALFLKI